MLAVSRAEAGRMEVKNATGDGFAELYIGKPGTIHAGPQAYMVGMPVPGARTEPHFHDIDQFQIAVEGSGVIGKRELKPVTIQYADAFTPYGPIIAEKDGLNYFTLRAAASNGFFRMPGSKDKMQGKAGRNIAASFETGRVPKSGAEQVSVIERTDDGMKVTGLRIAPNQSCDGVALDGGGQYYLVCTGSLIQNGKTLPRFSLLFVDAGEALPTLQAGPDGAEIVVSQFPYPSDRPGSDPAVLAKRDAASYTMPPGTKFD